MATVIATKDWGSTITLTTALTFTSNEAFSASYSMTSWGGPGALISVSAFFVTSANNDLETRVYAVPDSGDRDDHELFPITVSAGSDSSKKRSFFVHDVPRFVLGGKAASTTENIQATFRVKPWRWRSV